MSERAIPLIDLSKFVEGTSAQREAFVAELEAPPVSGGVKENVHLSPEEVEAWLALFEEKEG